MINILNNKSVWVFICFMILVNIGIGIDVYLKNKKPKHTPPPPPPAVTQQTETPPPAPEPELPRVPVHWVIPEVMISGEVIDGNATDETCIDNYLVIRKMDGTQVVVNDVEWSVWKAVEKGDFIN